MPIRSRAARLAALQALLWTASPSGVLALEAHQDAAHGEWQGDKIRVRWTEARRTAYSPETVIFVENTSPDTVGVLFEWESRACNGEPLRPGRGGFSFARELFGADSLGIRSVLKPGAWDALIFPRGLPPERALSSADGCTSRIRIHTSPSPGGDRVDFTLPAPLPPAGKHE